jgi:hypothetical protein
VTAPERGVVPGFFEIVIVNAPERLPVALAGMAIHDAALTADHVQPVSVSIVSVTVPPFAETAEFAGATL